jgi:DDE superfamily endonuclease
VEVHVRHYLPTDEFAEAGADHGDAGTGLALVVPGLSPTHHGILDAVDTAEVPTVADTGHQGAGPTVRVPQRRRRLDPDTGHYRRLSANQKAVNTAHARQRGPGERANAQLKSWKILRKIRSSPGQATTLVKAVQTLILAG